MTLLEGAVLKENGENRNVQTEWVSLMDRTRDLEGRPGSQLWPGPSVTFQGGCELADGHPLPLYFCHHLCCSVLNKQLEINFKKNKE